ncbi:formylglycine-generating enzyme family protein [Saccharospirillum salsuginis]|uniref:Sulfatase-modifying factor enzyme-like domain-containing protein n=1 Tax=Saccharospirillum salsuginis TaxID=418750 RepID=A0A918KRM0_9GAMM|nr:formylglycine-generating enzyme family protein [Saccharospirillum salsuginis]GGX70839.1 hypothetical protein GCM10007392_42900 [Saccharospirillum salsuginis]
MLTRHSLCRGTLLIGLPLIAACQDPAPPEDVDALIERTLDNLVYVEGGSFMMGDIGYEVPESDPDGEWVTMADGSKSYRKPFGCNAGCYPMHKVTLTGYYINKYETTYGEYDVYTEANGLPRAMAEVRGKAVAVQPERPVYVGVDWYGARDYCQWLGKITGLAFDLPTEAQWEYAARSRGRAVRYATDNGKMEPGRNYRSLEAEAFVPDVPGRYPPNPLGLYDMTGNVNEWVRDWYHHRYYEQSPELDPQGPEYDNLYATQKVSRGSGLANSDWTRNLVFRRLPRNPENDGSGEGFRCALHSDEPLHDASELPLEGVGAEGDI